MNAITIAHLSDIHHNPDENSQISTLLREKGLLVEKLLGQCLEERRKGRHGDTGNGWTFLHGSYLR